MSKAMIRVYARLVIAGRKTIDDVPDYYRNAVQKCVDAGALGGVGGGRLHISEDMCRTLTVLDRLGKL